MDYQSQFTGSEIDARLTKAGTAVQGVKVNGADAPKDAEGKVAITVPEAAGITAEIAAAVAVEKARAQGEEARIEAKIPATEGFATKAYVDATFVEKEEGKGLSSNDFTNAEKTKLAGLENYDDSALAGRVSAIEGKEAGWDAKADVSDIPTTLADLSGDSTHRVVTDAEKTAWSGKQDAISDLDSIRSGAALGATALQSVPSTYRTAAAQDIIDATKIDDAPSDGKQYARENGAWSEVHHRPYDTLERLAGYLYKITYGALDYDYARAYFEAHAPVVAGSCSAIGSEHFLGRNYDWKNNYDASFVVITPAGQGRHLVYGMAGGLDSLTVDIVDSRAYAEAYKILPFYLLDGKNDAGLSAEINVVPAAGNTQTVPAVEKEDRICALMLVRYILDNFSSVSEAVAYLRDHVEIYFPTTLTDMGYEAHWMLKDATNCVVLEIVDNEVVTVESNISTNFHLSGVIFNADGSVYTNADVADGNLPTSQGIEDYGQGMERWNILNAATITDRASMRSLLDSVNFTKAYTLLTDVWHSEFVGGGITVDTPADDADMTARIALYRQKYADRSKDTAETWLTVHSVIYDLASDTMYIKVQEGENEYEVALYVNYVRSVNNTLPDENGNVNVSGGVPDDVMALIYAGL